MNVNTIRHNMGLWIKLVPSILYKVLAPWNLFVCGWLLKPKKNLLISPVVGVVTKRS